LGIIDYNFFESSLFVNFKTDAKFYFSVFVTIFLVGVRGASVFLSMYGKANGLSSTYLFGLAISIASVFWSYYEIEQMRLTFQRLFGNGEEVAYIAHGVNTIVFVLEMYLTISLGSYKQTAITSFTAKDLEKSPVFQNLKKQHDDLSAAHNELLDKSEQSKTLTTDFKKLNNQLKEKEMHASTLLERIEFLEKQEKSLKSKIRTLTDEIDELKEDNEILEKKLRKKPKNIDIMETETSYYSQNGKTNGVIPKH
jgi:ABC-type transporter Mla subunit MlaD